MLLVNVQQGWFLFGTYLQRNKESIKFLKSQILHFWQTAGAAMKFSFFQEMHARENYYEGWGELANLYMMTGRVPKTFAREPKVY